MAELPCINTIQASDAPQHTGMLQEILQHLKVNKKIGDFTIRDPDENLSSLTKNNQEEDLILLVLNLQLEPYKERIENRLKVIKAKQPEASVADIILDNVVYDNIFVTFPTDLRPIHEREDLDDAWSSIEQNLKELFPVKKREEPIPEKKDRKQYIKAVDIFSGLSILCFGLLFLFTVWLLNWMSDRDDVLMYYVVVIALTVAFLLIKRILKK